MRTTRVLPIALASALALASTGCGSGFERDEPQTAARDFLSDVLATNNGQRACDFMTQRAQRIFAGDQPGASCREVIERAQLVGDGDELRVDTTGEVKDLEYSTEKSGEDKAVVTVKTNGGPTLRLTLAHSEGLGNLYEAPTPWRITGGAEPLIKGS
ncbi:unannotated protein [freshwater metagenome]|uniref:Unannotated protein n=1 Tax=freshwater metagenome TaxID=449393 RepID=A0A6J7GXM5_9ZZZZ|nr:hypothetical protein [Actinomycetota bacterium]